MTSLARELARLSAQEMVAALGVRGAPELLQRGLALPFFAASRQLGETLAELDGAVGELGLPSATRQALRRFGVALEVSGCAVPQGPCLVLANHPGAYDALASMSALGREDLRVLAADRQFLRALPRLSRHFLWVSELSGETSSRSAPLQRAGALKSAARHLRQGGALLHFPAGKIEPDAAFDGDAARWLEPWQPGVSTLVKACARAGGRVLVAGVRGVHSPRAKRWLLNRLAERRGITTLSPLLQMFCGLRDVVTRVHCQDAGDAQALSHLPPAEQHARLRTALTHSLISESSPNGVVVQNAG